jgi:hypothetical protein
LDTVENRWSFSALSPKAALTSVSIFYSSQFGKTPRRERVQKLKEDEKISSERVIKASVYPIMPIIFGST